MKPIDRKIIDEVFAEVGITDMEQATIRQCVRAADGLEQRTGTSFVHLEIGNPSIPASPIGIEAQKKALDDGVEAKYPNIAGTPLLKRTASEFIKAFVNIDIPAKCIVPTVGSMQGCYNTLLECSQLQSGRDTVLYIDPGFPAQHTQTDVLGIPRVGFDIYDYRGEKLRAKLESYLAKGNICALLFSNPNNPSWVCLTEQELQIVGELCTKYDVIAIEDMAYFCMDFRTDKGKPYVPPFQPTVQRYTSNCVTLISSSKMFSYAGERIGLVAINPKLYERNYPELMRRYHISSYGLNFELTYLYTASSGTAHSPQYALAAMMQAAIDGKFNFVHVTEEYGRRAHLAKEIFERHGFQIVYTHDLDVPVADGFFFTATYPGMSSGELLLRLLQVGIVAIALETTGSRQRGLRICIAMMSPESKFQDLDGRLGLFEQMLKQ